MKLRRILAPVDFSDPSRRALAHAFAVGAKTDAEVTVLHACTLPPYVAPSVALKMARGDSPVTASDLARSAAAESMTKLLADIPPPKGSRVSQSIEIGIAFEVIQAMLPDFDLVVMGTHSRTGIDRLFLGSVTNKVVRESTVPVMIVHADGDPIFPPKRILVGVDFSDCAKAAMDAASELSDRFGSELSLVHAIPHVPALQGAELFVVTAGGESTEPYYDMARAHALEEMNLFLTGKLEGHLEQSAVGFGQPSDVILDRAQEIDADMIAIGTHGRTGLARIGIGSVAERIIRRARIPVLVIHKED